jgi:adenylate kinase
MLNFFKRGEEKKANPKAFIFIGRSGCGKGTQVELFKEELKKRSSAEILHVETGAFFREFLKSNGYTQDLTREVVDNGGLMPAGMAINLWINYLIRNFTGKENLLFDGCPRKLPEAELLDGMLKFYKIPDYTVIYINASREWCTERLLARGRKDDTKEGIDSRMTWFETDVVPCINFFKSDKDCKVFDINGEQTIEEVHQEIRRAVFGL